MRSKKANQAVAFSIAGETAGAFLFMRMLLTDYPSDIRTQRRLRAAPWTPYRDSHSTLDLASDDVGRLGA